VALDLTIDEALRREGLAREAVRALNDLRKRRDLALSDRIRVRVGATGDVAEALREHAASIRAEVLAVELEVGESDLGETLDLGNGQSMTVALEVAAA
jgi:isoleucyl-tRNA synthetase